MNEGDWKSMAHTPGPWKVAEDDKAKSLSMKVMARKGKGWASVLYAWKNSTNELRMSANQVRANARLIAAAPEMLGALEDLCDSLGECAATKRAREVIEKATNG